MPTVTDPHDALADLQIRMSFQDATIADLDETIRQLRDEVDRLREEIASFRAELRPAVEDGPPPHW